jgi:hypothetical protein
MYRVVMRIYTFIVDFLNFLTLMYLFYSQARAASMKPYPTENSMSQIMLSPRKEAGSSAINN